MYVQRKPNSKLFIPSKYIQIDYLEDVENKIMSKKVVA